MKKLVYIRCILLSSAGIIKEFTGISDPYELPGKPEIEIDTRRYSPSKAAAKILALFESDGFVA